MNCKCSLNICDIEVNCAGASKINLNLTAPEEKDYKLKLRFLNSFRYISKTFESGDNLEFDVIGLNENYCYEIQVMDNEQPLSFTIGGKSINTFNFCTQYQISR